MTGLTVEKLQLAKRILQEADDRFEQKIQDDHAAFMRTGSVPRALHDRIDRWRCAVLDLP